MNDLPLLVFNHRFKFQDYVCNSCHDFTMLCFIRSDITITTAKNIDYRCIIYKSKSKVINLLASVALEKLGIYKEKHRLNFQSIQDFFCLVYVTWQILQTSISLKQLYIYQYQYQYQYYKCQYWSSNEKSRNVKVCF